jgi:hypothetical protein
MERLSKWSGPKTWEEPFPTESGNAVRLACDERGHWRGAALFIHENEAWTVFDDLTGGFGSIPADEWLKFALSNNFVFAGYNDAIAYAELIVITNGKIEREYLYCRESPEENVDRGILPPGTGEPFTTWIEVAGFVDDDLLGLGFCDEGWLWLRLK